MKIPLMAVMVMSLLILGGVNATAYNPCDPQYDTCQ